jgi:hypothetical protein
VKMETIDFARQDDPFLVAALKAAKPRPTGQKTTFSITGTTSEENPKNRERRLRGHIFLPGLAASR